LNHHTSPEFWQAFARLPADVQTVARNNYEMLKMNPRHPSLHFKKVGGQWSVRVGLGHRALGIDVDDGILWIWVGTHAEYDKII
jgi:hypothetical protein